MSLSEYYLNGTKLCPWNFSLSESQELIGADERILDGTLRRDVVARKRAWAMSWDTLHEVFDGTYHGYNDLRALGTASGTMTFIRAAGTSTGTEQYTVMVEPPTGDLALRSDGVQCYWNVGLGVRQV